MANGCSEGCRLLSLILTPSLAVDEAVGAGTPGAGRVAALLPYSLVPTQEGGLVPGGFGDSSSLIRQVNLTLARHSLCHCCSCLRLPSLSCPLPILTVGTGVRAERCQEALRAKSPSLSLQKEAWPEAARDLPNCPGLP